MESLSETDKCYQCDPTCAPLKQCTKGICKGFGIIFIISFTLCGVLLGYRLYQFYKHKPHQKWSLKKLLFMCGIITCFLRVLRNTLLLAGLPFKAYGWFVLDLFLYFYAFFSLFSMYLILLAFWSHMLQKNKTPRSWINKRMQVILVTSTVMLFLLMTAIPILYLIPGSDANLIGICVGFIFMALIFGLGVMMAIDGFKVLQLVKELNSTSTSHSSQTLRLLTKLIVGSSCVLIATVVALIASSITFTVDQSTDTCMSFMMVYRILELSIMALIAVPLRRYENKEQATRISTPARQSICEVTVEE